MRRIQIHIVLLPVILLAILNTVGIAQRLHTIGGSVRDSATGEPLAAVNIRIGGTAMGTIANAQGNFRLSLPEGTATLLFSAIGYESRSITIVVPSPVGLEVRLSQSPVVVPEFLVLAEDPAVEIIRKAIANKRKWMNLLKTYRFDAFTRQTLYRDTAIASISEAYTTGYMSSGDTLREIVRQKRQTQNIPVDNNAAAVRSIVNFNEDEIRLFQISIGTNSNAYTFIGPTAPGALEYYDYTLLGTSTVNRVDVYTIRMMPRSNLRPLFEGVITIADGTFAVMGVDVKPNETLSIPFLRDIDLRYRQQFSLYDSLFWMPSDIRISGGFSVSLIGFTLPRIAIEQTSSIYDYSLNIQIPDSVLGKPRVSSDSSATRFDSTFWNDHDVLPLTAKEQTAYTSLDSSQTLDKQFEPKGPLATLGSDNVSGILGIVDARFNRVEGFFLGASSANDSWIPSLELRCQAGAGFSDKVFKYAAGATWHSGRIRRIEVGADVYRQLANIPDGNFYGALSISFMSLLNRNDYRDYYLQAGWRGFIAVTPVRNVRGEIAFTDEQQYTMENRTDYSFFGRRPYRTNPPIDDGRMRSLSASIRIGSEPVPLGIVSRDALEVGMEVSHPGFLKSEFDFRRYWGSLEFSVPTFGRALLFPPKLHVRVIGGTSGGTLPPQRWLTLDSRSSGYGPFGVLRGANVKEFVAETYVMANVEHNFRSIPFLLLGIPFLYRNGVEVLVHGSYARIRNVDDPYAEAGFGISRIFDLFRADLTYRFSNPRGVTFSLGIATLF
jgi:hypothetical protein